MKCLEASIVKFAGLDLRERILAVAATAVVLYFTVDLALLGPQQKQMVSLRLQDKTHQTELAGINKVLAALAATAPDVAAPSANDPATLDTLKKQIADADSIYRQLDSTTSQVGTLVEELLVASPELTLVSLKTLPVAPFQGLDNKPGSGKPGEPGIDVAKTIYKHGVEVSIKGNYMALLAYMENLQNYPHALFWSEAKLDVPAHAEVVLRLVLYSLSRQPSSPLR